MPDIPGEVIALITVLSWSIGIFPFTEAAKRVGAGPLNKYRLLLAWLIISILLLVWKHLKPADLFILPNSNHYLWFIVSGIIGFTLGDYFGLSSFAILGPKLASVYTTFAPVFALFGGIFLLDETINGIGIAGIFTTLAGVIWLSLSKKDNFHAKSSGFDRNTKGILFAITGAACQGLGLVLSKKGFQSGEIQSLHAVWLRLLGGFSGALLLSVIAGNLKAYFIPVWKNEKNMLPFMIAGTLFGPVIGVSLSLITIQKMEVAAAQTIFALMPVIVLPLNVVIYKEKITISSLLACLTAIAGVILIVWRNSI